MIKAAVHAPAVINDRGIPTNGQKAREHDFSRRWRINIQLIYAYPKIEARMKVRIGAAVIGPSISISRSYTDRLIDGCAELIGPIFGGGCSTGSAGYLVVFRFRVRRIYGLGIDR